MLKNMLIMMVGCIVLIPVPGVAADKPNSGPQAFLPEGVYEFQPVVEGSQVLHEFILHNRGDKPLEIIKIESG